MRFSPGLLKGVDSPHRQIGHQQKSHYFPAWFSAKLLGCGDSASGCVKNEDGLTGGLNDAGQGCHQNQYGLLLKSKMAAYHREDRVDKHAGLGSDQQNTVQFEITMTIEAEFAHLKHTG